MKLRCGVHGCDASADRRAWIVGVGYVPMCEAHADYWWINDELKLYPKTEPLVTTLRQENA